MYFLCIRPPKKNMSVCLSVCLYEPNPSNRPENRFIKCSLILSSEMLTLLYITITPTMLYAAFPEKWSFHLTEGEGEGGGLGVLFLKFLDPPLENVVCCSVFGKKPIWELWSMINELTCSISLWFKIEQNNFPKQLETQIPRWSWLDHFLRQTLILV